MKRTQLEKAATWRVIAARIPPVQIFEEVAAPGDFDALMELEAAFSPHYNQIMALEGGLPRDEWVFGPGAGYIMAPFVYRAPSRFTDGSFGVYYGGLDEATAVAEVAYHRARFLAATRESATILEQAVLSAQVSGAFTDIRGAEKKRPELYDPDPARYAPAQAWAAEQRAAHTDGIAYTSVRHPGGECVAVFRPKAVHHCGYLKPFRYFWDGRKITAVA